MSETRLFRDGRIFTGHRYVEAMLVEDGRIRTVGTLASVERATPAGAEVERLSGRLVVPGLIDAHLHLGEATRAREGFNLAEARSVADLVGRLAARSAAHPGGAVVGHGWDAERFADRRWPLAADLDRAVADRPVVLYHASGHAAVVNTAALRAAGVDRASSEPRNGRFGRTTDGRPDGRLFEGAMASLTALVSDADLADPPAIERTLELCASFGLTTVATMSTGPEEAGLLRGLAEVDRLPIRVRLYLRMSRLGEFPRPALAPAGRPDRFAVLGTKGFTDGAFGPRTAWLSAPYTDLPSEEGMPVGTDEELGGAIERSVKLGLAPALHAIGDRAVERAARLLRPWTGQTRSPVRIEHAALTPPASWPSMEEAHPALVVQPGFVWSDHWLGARLGPERARWGYAFRSLLGRGFLLAGSSDAPYDPLDPWRGIRAAVERSDPASGRSANPSPGEALDPETALRLYTVNGGRALGTAVLGTLEPASRADFVVLDVPHLRGAVGRGAASVRETWVDGARAYHRHAGSPEETV